MAIIALSGWKGSGKDTLAKFLIENHGFRRVAFADVLKDMVSEQYGISRKSLDDSSQKERAILDLPVDPQDGFSQMITNFLYKEFRTASGQVPELGQASFWTPRALAILEGSIKRSVNSRYWVQRALQTIAKNEKVVLTDMRYGSEMTQIVEFAEKNDQNLVTVRIERFNSSPSSDPSERDLDNADFDITIDNRGDLKDLEFSARFLASELKL
jgi:adenylate kinase family enzyme